MYRARETAPHTGTAVPVLRLAPAYLHRFSHSFSSARKHSRHNFPTHGHSRIIDKKPSGYGFTAGALSRLSRLPRDPRPDPRHSIVASNGHNPIRAQPPHSTHTGFTASTGAGALLSPAFGITPDSPRLHAMARWRRRRALPTGRQRRKGLRLVSRGGRRQRGSGAASADAGTSSRREDRPGGGASLREPSSRSAAAVQKPAV